MNTRVIHARGFTLIELLIALTIFAIMAALAWRGLTSMTESRAHLAAEAHQWQDLALFFRRMEDDVTHAVNRPWRDKDGQPVASWQAKPVLNTGNDANLVLVSLKADERGVQKVGYRYRDGEIDALWWPAPDDAPAQQPEVYPLLTGVKTFALHYLANNGQWVDQWPLAGQVGALPRAVAVNLTLRAGITVYRVFALP